MKISNNTITTVDFCVFLSRVATYSLSAIFAYKFVGNQEKTALILALVVITFVEIARVESFRALLKGTGNWIDFIIFSVTLTISIVTLLSVISSSTLSVTNASDISDTRISQLNTNITTINNQIVQLEKEIDIYTGLRKLELKVDERKVNLQQLQDKREQYQTELVQVKSQQGSTVLDGVSDTVEKALGFSSTTVKSWLLIFSAILIDVFVLYFIYRQHKQNQTNGNAHTQELTNSCVGVTQSKNSISVNSDTISDSSSCNSSVKTNTTSDQKNNASKPTQLDQYVTEAINLISAGKIKKGFRTKLRVAFGVADKTAADICECLVAKRVIERKGESKFYQLTEEFKKSLVSGSPFQHA